MGREAAPLLALFSDFGARGPYVGQVMAVWAGAAAEIPRVELFSESPAFDIEAGAHLLHAFTRHLPPGSVVEAVVDPGVGGPRAAVAAKADGLWFVAPDNGLLTVVLRRAAEAAAWRIDWRPQALSATFHGRDLFAPIAATIARTGAPPPPFVSVPLPSLAHDVADPAFRVIWTDVYGNLMIGMRAAGLPTDALLVVGDETLGFASRFGEKAPGEAFWYGNACGLVEISVNCGSAAARFGGQVPIPVRVITREGKFAPMV